MKKLFKIIFTTPLILVLFGACNNSDDDNNANDKKKVISKITTKYLYNDGSKEKEIIEINTFSYLDGKLTKIDTSYDDEILENFCSIFNYEGSRIISSSSCEDAPTLNILNYSGDKLIKASSDEVVSEFFYNADKLDELIVSCISDNFAK